MSTRLRADSVGDAVDLRHERTRGGTDHDLVEPGPPALFHLPRLSQETRAGGDRGYEADGHAEGDRRLVVGIAGGAEGDVGHGEDDASVRKTLEVDHVRLERETETAVAAPDFEVVDPERAGPGVVLHAGRELARYRLSGRLRH